MAFSQVSSDEEWEIADDSNSWRSPTHVSHQPGLVAGASLEDEQLSIISLGEANNFQGADKRDGSQNVSDSFCEVGTKEDPVATSPSLGGFSLVGGDGFSECGSFSALRNPQDYVQSLSSPKSSKLSAFSKISNPLDYVQSLSSPNSSKFTAFSRISNPLGKVNALSQKASTFSLISNPNVLKSTSNLPNSEHSGSTQFTGVGKLRFRQFDPSDDITIAGGSRGGSSSSRWKYLRHCRANRNLGRKRRSGFKPRSDGPLGVISEEGEGVKEDYALFTLDDFKIMVDEILSHSVDDLAKISNDMFKNGIITPDGGDQKLNVAQLPLIFERLRKRLFTRLIVKNDSRMFTWLQLKVNTRRNLIPLGAEAWQIVVKAFGLHQSVDLEELVGVFDYECFEALELPAYMRKVVMANIRQQAVPMREDNSRDSRRIHCMNTRYYNRQQFGDQCEPDEYDYEVDGYTGYTFNERGTAYDDSYLIYFSEKHNIYWDCGCGNGCEPPKKMFSEVSAKKNILGFALQSRRMRCHET